MAWQHNHWFHFPDPRHRGIEVVDLEPEEHAVAVRLIVAVTDWPVMMFNLEMVELENQGAVRNEPFVVRAAVRALTTEQALIPPAAGFDVGDGDERLWTHDGGMLSQQCRCGAP